MAKLGSNAEVHNLFELMAFLGCSLWPAGQAQESCAGWQGQESWVKEGIEDVIPSTFKLCHPVEHALVTDVDQRHEVVHRINPRIACLISSMRKRKWNVCRRPRIRDKDCSLYTAMVAMLLTAWNCEVAGFCLSVNDASGTATSMLLFPKKQRLVLLSDAWVRW